MTRSHPDIRHVIFHKPGPKWAAGVAFREQPGVMQHVEYFQKINAEGKLAFGGPFLDNSGGMMIPAAQLSEAEVHAIAANDPSVKSGLVTFEIRSWYVAMRA